MKGARERSLMLMQGIFNENFCENCHEEGHRTWACPHELTHTRNIIKCSICGEISHPTSDCPDKAEHLKKQQINQQNMLLESQYSKFKEELNTDKKKEAVGTAFITDFSRKDLMAIEASR